MNRSRFTKGHLRRDAGILSTTNTTAVPDTLPVVLQKLRQPRLGHAVMRSSERLPNLFAFCVNPSVIPARLVPEEIRSRTFTSPGFESELFTHGYKGSAQFALQVFTQHREMVTRYDIGRTNKITLVVRWREGQVTFEKYNGIHKLDHLPTQEKFEWTTPSGLTDFVPTPGCVRFHINLWLGNFDDTNWNHLPDFAPHAGPTDGEEVEVVIRNFEFQQP